MINFYESKQIKKFINKADDPHYDDHHIGINSRTVIIGGSGSGKTNAIMNYIRLAPDTFNHIYVIFKEMEPIYEMLQDQLKKGITFYDDIAKLPNLEVFNKGREKEDECLIIFDDQINESTKKIDKVSEYFLRGRKKHITCFFISQSFFKIPKFLRQNVNNVILMKIGSEKDLKLIMREFCVGVSIEKMYEMYEESTRKDLDFFKIDVSGRNLNEKYSHNFVNCFKIKNDDNPIENDIIVEPIIIEKKEKPDRKSKK